jgi:murein L,D-transpeptidase YcbB/YkuD
MRARMITVIAASAVVLGGCAGQRSSQELNRLKADVGLLDQRVSQLERTSLRQSSATSPVGALAPVSVRAIPEAPAIQSSSRPTIKPSKTEIQRALKAAGFYQGSVDGKIGPQTKAAIREFQRAHGLVDDGVVGARTWEKLSIYLNDTAGSSELSAAESLK